LTERPLARRTAQNRAPYRDHAHDAVAGGLRPQPFHVSIADSSAKNLPLFRNPVFIMRIDVFFDVYPHPAKPYFEAQLTEWRRRGQVIRLFSLGQIPGAHSEFPITFIHTLRRHPLRLSGKILFRLLTNPARSARIWSSERGFREKIKRLATDAQLPVDAPDVYFMHNLATAVHFSYLRNAAPATAIAIYYHGGEIPGVRQIPFEESAQALGRAHIVFSNTDASVKEVVARGASAERTARIPVGFPLERFSVPSDRCYLPGGSWRFVCLGRVAREKGFDMVLRAFARLKQRTQNFTLTLIGTGPELPNLKELAGMLALADSVRFAGYIESYQEMVNRLGTFDALIFSSLPVQGSNFRDTQACVMQEAMLMGACVIASEIGGIRESLPPGLHPFLYRPGSEDELLSRLSNLMSRDAVTVQTLAQSARRFVLENYDIHRVNGELLAKLAALPARKDEGLAAGRARSGQGHG
jgi:glycosyltransferase involved in cell wall biosynthesis